MRQRRGQACTNRPRRCRSRSSGCTTPRASSGRVRGTMVPVVHCVIGRHRIGLVRNVGELAEDGDDRDGRQSVLQRLGTGRPGDRLDRFGRGAGHRRRSVPSTRTFRRSRPCGPPQRAASPGSQLELCTMPPLVNELVAAPFAGPYRRGSTHTMWNQPSSSAWEANSAGGMFSADRRGWLVAGTRGRQVPPRSPLPVIVYSPGTPFRLQEPLRPSVPGGVRIRAENRRNSGGGRCSVAVISDGRNEAGRNRS